MTTHEPLRDDSLPDDQLLSQAVALHRSGNLQEAERLYRVVLTNSPDHPDANHNLGVLAVQVGQPGTALPFFQAALAANSGSAQFWLSYLDALILTGHNELAGELLADARRRGLAGPAADALGARLAVPSPEEVERLVALFNERRLAEGERLASEMTERFPEYGFGWKALGAFIEGQQRPDEALPPMRKAALLLPRDVQAQTNLGNLQRTLGHHADSEASFRRALEITVDDNELHFRLGNTLAAQGRMDEALDCYGRGLGIESAPLEAGAGLHLVRDQEDRLGGEQTPPADVAVGGEAGAARAGFNPIAFCRTHGDGFFGKGVKLFAAGFFLLSMGFAWNKIGIGDGKAPPFAAKVGDSEIAMAAFDTSYNRNRELAKSRFGQAYTPELEKGLALGRTTLDALVDRELFCNMALRQGAKVTEDEVAQSIASLPVFQKKGAFDLETYTRILSRNKMTPQQFEKARLKDLLADKGRGLVTGAVVASDRELKELYHRERDGFVLSFLAVSPAEAAGQVKVGKAELTDFFEKNRKLFMTPEKVAISYLRLGADHASAKGAATPEEILRYYAQHQSSYRQPDGEQPPLEEVRARVSRDLQREKRVTALLDRAVASRYRNGQQTDLPTLARDLGGRVKKTGLFSAASLPAELSDYEELVGKMLPLKEGEIGGPFATADAVFFVRVDARQAAAPAAFAEVRQMIEERLRADKSQAASKAMAQEALVRLAREATLPGLKVTPAFSFAADGTIPGIGSSPELMAEVLSLPAQGAVATTVYPVADAWYAVRLKERLAAPEDDFGRARADLQKRVVADKRQKILERWLAAERGREKIEINKQLAAALDKEAGSRDAARR